MKKYGSAKTYTFYHEYYERMAPFSDWGIKSTTTGGEVVESLSGLSLRRKLGAIPSSSSP
jgi:hypothetical protein